jgi:adenosylmethionine-8-amino-7-oxononanoate aminotransferase
MPHAAAVAMHTIDEIQAHQSRVQMNAEVLSAAVRAAGRDFFKVHGQGAMWGMEWNIDKKHHAEASMALARACIRHGVWPYFVSTGIMITPPLDVCNVQLDRALIRLIHAVQDRDFCNHIDNLIVS